MVSDTLPDHYALLQVHPDADLQVIKKAYHTLMLDLGAHPDRGGDPERAKQINRAWEILRDTDQRRAYDAERRRAREASRPSRPVSADPIPFGLDPVQWQTLQLHGELKVKGHQAAGDRRCACRRCGRTWLTRSFSGMPARCPSCRSGEWSWQRYVHCYVCQHAFEVADLHAPTPDTAKHCPACKTTDWALRPVVMTCLACGTPNRIRRSAWARARCGTCQTAFYAREGPERLLRRWLRQGWGHVQTLLDRLLLRPLGSL